jgi:hypothetical protein
MVSGKSPPPDNPGARKKRPPTVLNLEATEVPPETGATPSETAPAAETPEPEPVVNPPEAEPVKEVASEPPQPKASEEPPRESPHAEPKSDTRRSIGWLPGGLSWTHARAGIAGAAGALLVVLLLWLAGALSGGGQSQTADLSPRLASIEKQLKDLADRPAALTVDPKALDTLASRLTKLENAQATPRAPVTDPVVLGRINSTENAMKSAADNIAALSRRADATDAAVRETNSKVDKLGATLAEVQTMARSAAAGSDRASRLALAAAALRDAVDHGQPFAAELAVVKPLSPDAALVATLEPFAASGVPGDAALAKELSGIVRPMLRASEQKAPGGSFMDRLQANAEKLVRIERIDEPKGDGRDAGLARVSQYASQNNVAAAVNDLAKLPPDARAPMLGWISRGEARNTAVNASRRLAADAVAALQATP